MSAFKVLLTSADDRLAPPEEVIEIAMADDHPSGQPLVFIAVAKYDEDHTTSTTTEKVKVPVLRLEDLLRALIACDDRTGGRVSPAWGLVREAYERAEIAERAKSK